MLIRLLLGSYLLLSLHTCALRLWPDRPLFARLNGEPLRDALREEFRPSEVYGYGRARDLLYAEVDRQRDSVTCIYTGYRRYLPDGVDPSKYLYEDGQADGLNCEHAWPRSKGADHGQAFSDLHHLFPCRVAVNQARSNRTYGEVPDQDTRRWYYRHIVTSDPPPPAWRDLYSELGPQGFEPRESVKGDLARAMLYFYTMYGQQADDGFFLEQLPTLRQWHHHDPPDDSERARTWRIAALQDNKPNPFVLDTSLVRRAYGALAQ